MSQQLRIHAELRPTSELSWPDVLNRLCEDGHTQPLLHRLLVWGECGCSTMLTFPVCLWFTQGQHLVLPEDRRNGSTDLILHTWSKMTGFSTVLMKSYLNFVCKCANICAKCEQHDT